MNSAKCWLSFVNQYDHYALTRRQPLVYSTQKVNTMKAFIRNILAATALTIGTVGIAFGASPTLNDINATVTSLVSEGNVHAVIDGSVVTLTGYVSDGSIRSQVENKVRGMSGVTDVINEITTE